MVCRALPVDTNMFRKEKPGRACVQVLFPWWDSSLIGRIICSDWIIKHYQDIRQGVKACCQTFVLVPETPTSVGRFDCGCKQKQGAVNNH